MAAAGDFRGSRLALAQTLLERSRRASEIARELQKPTGAISGVLARMVADGVIVADTGEPTRGTRYSLTPEARAVIAEIQAGIAEPGQILSGRRLIVVEQAQSPIELQRVLRSEDAQHIDWAIETGEGGWLISINSEESFPVQRLRARLERAGATSRETQARAILSGEELIARADWLLEDLERAP